MEFFVPEVAANEVIADGKDSTFDGRKAARRRLNSYAVLIRRWASPGGNSYFQVKEKKTADEAEDY